MRLGIEAGPHTRDAAKELGIKGVPIDAGDLVGRGPAAVLEPLRAEGLQVCQIGAFGYNPLHPDPAVLDRQRNLLEQAIPLAPQTGCRYIVINGGNLHPSGFQHGVPENFTDDSLDTVARQFTPLLQLAERHNVCLSIEPYIKSAIGSPEQFLKLVERVGSPALRINIDVTNFFDLRDTFDGAATIRHVCRSLAGRYGLVHIKDIRLKEGFHIHIELAPLEQGVTDWALVLAEVAPHVPEESWVLLEHLASMEEARRSVELLRSAAARAGVSLS